MQGDTPCMNTVAVTNALFTCACQPGTCQEQCGSFCGGGTPDATCQDCMMLSFCPNEYAACEADTGAAS